MPDEPFMARQQLVVIYPYKFHDFVYNLLELSEFKPYCDVAVWDISPITAPGFAKAVSAKRSPRNDVIVVPSLRDFARRTYELRKRSATSKICIVNEVTNGSLFEFICNLLITALLRTENIAVLDLYNGGVPLRYLGGATQPNLGFVAKARRFAGDVSTLPEALKKFSSVFFRLLARLLPTATTHRLVAGEDWRALVKTPGAERKQIRYVYGHSHDYSNYLLCEQKPVVSTPPPKKTAVLLDGAGPVFGSDAVYLGRKVHFTADAWFPALSRLFDRLETETGVRIEIAGHYKTTHPAVAPYFGKRPVYYGKTRELVRNSEFVITRASTAISYAVMFRKPVIFIYSNQLKEDRMAMRDICGLAGTLGTEPVNIDEPIYEIGRLLNVNEERYRGYEKACLTSAGTRKPNAHIILEDVMKIAVCSESHAGCR